MVFRLDEGVLVVPAFRRRAAQLRSGASARLRVAVALTQALALLAGSACERPLEVVQTSYLAIVLLVDDSATARTLVHYRVTELSGTLGIDTVVSRAARDTVILDVPPATYTVTVDGLPATCGIPRGTAQMVEVYPPPSTALARYFAFCRPTLTLATLVEGAAQDSQFIWRLDGPGAPRVGVIRGNDSLRLDSVAAGRYTLRLGLVADNCVITSDGGAEQSLEVPETGGAAALFRVACSDEARRPRLLAMAASYHDGAAAFAFRAVDPDRDIERYWWDLTDCSGRSMLSSGPLLRRGLSSGRTALADTVVVAAGFEIGLPDSAVHGRCAALRVADEAGNTTPVVEQPLTPGAGAAPLATSFNAYYLGNSAVHIDVQGLDPDGDFVGYFVQLRLRDGVLAPPDGEPDLGIYNAAGYDALPLPEVPLGGGRIGFGDVLAVIVYLVDARGNFVRLEDADLFH
jgi:hypothetical protein